MAGPMAGNMFENFIVIEFLKYKINSGLNFNIYFLRDSNKNEIDIILDYGEKIKAIEIKMRSTIYKKSISFLNNFAINDIKMEKYLLSGYNDTIQLTKEVKGIYWKNFESIINS